MLARGGIKHGFSRLSDRLGAGESPFIGQKFYNKIGTTADTVPSGALFAFVEAIAHGGPQYASGGGRRGGSGNDAIVAVAAGQAVSVVVPLTPNQASGATLNAFLTTVSLAGIVVLTAGNGTTATAGTGKYPGVAGTGNDAVGGGRLAGSVGVINGFASGNMPFGIGSGGSYVQNYYAFGGLGAACITYFTTYDAALDFAKFLYGGTWTA